ncbi:MAG: hypothetical protein ABR861_14055 [Terriglobales bacterium]|jgi:hypothetical protein
MGAAQKVAGGTKLLMCNTNALWTIKRLLVTALTPVLLFGGQVNGQAEKDPHRPACTSAHCRKIKSFLKAHYCGESPYGNGPDDGCEIRPPKKLGTGIKVTAGFDCKWIEGVSKCQQHGQPSSEVRGILIAELRRLGLPAKASGQVYFTVWESTASGWSLAAADYDHSAGADSTLCQVIVIIDESSQVHVLRKVPFQKTDADVPAVTTWSPIDLADVNGDGHIEVILEGDAYEDHWLEVDNVQDGSTHTIFSGLGYHL